MGYNRFYLNIIIHVILISLCWLGTVYFLFEEKQVATGLICTGISIFFTGRLIHYLNRTNRLLDQFLSNMKDHDPTFLLSSKFITSTFSGFQEKLQAIANDLKNERLEKESQARYLQSLLDHMTAGIISVDSSGKIEMINKTAQTYLNVSHLSHLKDLGRIMPGLDRHLQSLKPEDIYVSRFFSSGQLRVLSFKVSRIKLLGDLHTILIFHDIKNELEEQEIESWKKLLRIVTHEIMNSITPIVNLTAALKKRLQSEKGELLQVDDREAHESLNIIEERSRGIIHFISQYKKLTKLPPMELKELKINDLFNKIFYLFKEQLDLNGIQLIMKIRHKKALIADKNMVEQVLINLVKNAIEALSETNGPSIELHTFIDTQNRIHIEVKDNGHGVQEKFKDQVFIPFFTTKKNGSGIGLSLSRQIMRLHKGDINFDSTKKGTTVGLIF